MKKLVLALLICVFSISAFSQQRVLISDDNNILEDNQSAILELFSKNKGFLLPRVTTDERNQISNPSNSLLIFNKETQCIESYVEDWHSIWCLEESLFPINYVHCESPTEVVEITSETGRVWMDRNLGATRACLSSTDVECYGYWFQWGRFAEGHQCRSSDDYIIGLADTYLPDDGNEWYGKFITNDNDPKNWISTQEDDLWQGEENSTNNPCPKGFRLPTNAEWQAEIDQGSWTNAADAFNSNLKLPLAGGRSNSVALPFSVGLSGFYWASSVDNNRSQNISFSTNIIDLYSDVRAYGFSVRCIKD